MQIDIERYLYRTFGPRGSERSAGGRFARPAQQRRRKCRRTGPLLALLALTGACKPNSTDTLPAESHPNVSYGTNAAQVMDISLPAGRDGATAVVIFIHGGGWSGGDKSIFLATDLARVNAAGYATVNINYRLASTTPAVHDPMLSDDVTAAMDYIAAHASEYQISGSKFGMVGHSAGAHLALLEAYKYNATGRIKAVASLSGPTDFTDSAFLAIPGDRTLVEVYLGVTQAAAPARWTAVNPVSVVTATSPPTIIMQGAVDVIVPRSQGDRLHARLQSLGVLDEYHVYPTYDHDLGYAAAGHFPDDVLTPVLAWLAKYLK